MQPVYRINGDAHLVTPIRRGETHLLDVDGVQVEVAFRWVGPQEAFMVVAGQEHRVHVAQDDNVIFVHLDGHAWRIESVDGFAGGVESAAGGGGQVRSPMPGVMVALHTAVGQAVTEMDVLALIESMKMQTEIKSPAPGVVQAIHVAVGQSFGRGALLMEIGEAG